MPCPKTPLWPPIIALQILAGCGSLPATGNVAADGSVARDGPGDTIDADPRSGAGDLAPAPVTIVRTSAEPWGDNCPRGGVKIQTGLDLNGDHIIDSSDLTLPDQYVCNVYPVSVSLGARHGCALTSNGGVRCWGADEVGQLGDYGEYVAYAPRPVAGVEVALALAAGDDFSCVILPTTGVRCWGRNDRGQGGHGSDRPFIAPSCVTSAGRSLLGATSLALGGAHACVVLADGTADCWGANDVGQLGDGTTVDGSEPVAVRGIAEARLVAVGGRHACALLRDTTVRCWGSNDEGQLGDGTTSAPAAAVAVADAEGTATLSGVTALAAGDAFTCAVMDNESVLCWGSNADCQLGQPAAIPGAPRPRAAPVRGVRSLVAGAQHVCAVLGSGRAVCWGRNDFGQVGAAAGACRADPVELPLAHVLSLAAGRTHSCAVDEIGLWCWGDNSLGQLGIGIATATRSTAEPQGAIWQ